MNKKTGKFIVFEGLDGSGTTTQMQELAKRLLEAKKPFVITQEPTNNPIGIFIRKILRGEFKTSPLALQLLFTADRAHHEREEIKPLLKKKKCVLCDRYIYSTIAFGSLDLDSWFLTQLNRYFLVPDIVIYLKVPSSICIKRVKERGLKIEIFEEKKKLEKVEKMYDFLAERNKGNTIIIDGTKRIKEVAEEIWESIKRRL